MKGQQAWRVIVFGIVFFVLFAGAGMLAPSLADAASCQGAPAPCAEDPAIDNCTQCHSMGITGGNRNGTDRMITVSAASNRHILGPPLASWLSTVQGMISKGGGGDAARTAAYLDTNYCPTCNGPIMSSPTISDVQSDRLTVSWITSGSGFGDLPATSCVIYGTSLTEMTGDTCNPSDPNYDPNSGNLVTNHSVTITGLTGLTQYYIVHRSTAGANTATYAGATTVTTLPGGGGGGGGGALGIIVSLTIGDYNNDLNLDIGASVSTKNHVIPFLGNGAGGFSPGATLSSVGTTPSAITSGGVEGDINEDGNDDLVVANFGAESQNVAVFLGTSPSGFQTTPISSIPLADPPTGVALGDFNEDGVLDLAVATVQLDGAMGHLIIYTGVNDGSGHGTGQFTGPLNTYNIEVSTAVGPTITSIVPDTVDCTGLPVDITINGTLLLASATVTLDGVTPLTVLSGSPDNTSLTVRVPTGASEGAHSLIVTLGSLPPASAPFNITPRTVAVSSISPTSMTYGISAAGQVTVVGSGFTVGSTVSIGPLSGTTVAGVTANATTPFVFVNSGVIRVWVTNTSMPPGTHDVTVSNTDSCGGEATLLDAFTMVAPQPNVTSISLPNVTYGVTPSQQITISGSNFLLGAVINVGGLTGTTVSGTTATATTPYVYVSSTTLRFWWPNTSLSPGTYSVNVTNPGAAGGLTGTLVNGFTVATTQPAISSVSPPNVTYAISVSQSVSIVGSNFLVGSTITVGSVTGTTVAGSVATATTPFVWVNSNQVRFYWNNTALPPGSYAVQVTNPAESGGLSATLADGFTVSAPQPVVTSTSPSPVTYGITGSSSITIFGDNFVLGATITVGSLSGQTVAGSTATATTPFVFVSRTQVKFWWPNTSLAPGSHDVQVVNPATAGSLGATLVDGFTVTAPQPTLTNLSPPSVTYGISSSMAISVFGSNFIVGAQITIGSLSGNTVAGATATATVPYVHISAGQIRFWWPNTSLAPGVYSVTVTNPAAAGGLSANLASAFTVVAPQPTVTLASPSPVTYGITGSMSITVFGTNFINGATITVGSLSGATVSGAVATATTPFVWTNSGQVKFYWPNTSLPVGSYSVTVTNPAAAGGLSATLADAFVVSAPSPTISLISPSTVTYGNASQAVTISGSNFVIGGTITVGSLSGTTVSGATATASVPYVWVNSTTLRFWWPSTSLPVGTYDVVVANPASAGGLSTTATGGFVVQ